MADSDDRTATGAAAWRASGGRGLVDRISSATLGAFLSWAGDSQWRRAGLLTLICLALFLPGQLALGPTDRDESRFAQASKQMLESGDYIDIRLLDDARHKKPVGVYWAQTGAVHGVEALDRATGGAIERLTGAPIRDQIWVYRLPSVLGAMLASLLTLWATRPLIGPRAAFLAGAMCAGLLLLNVEARFAKTDALLLACVVGAMGALARLWFGERDDAATRGWNVFYLWTALGLGVLVKGPIVFLPVVGATLWMLVLTRDARPLGRLGFSWGIPWLLLIAAPWFVAIAVKTGGGFFVESLVEDLAAKAATGKEAHGAPPGYHLGVFWGVFWPWTPLAVLAAPWVWGWRKAPETAFLLGWLIPTFVLFELVPTKLPHYPLPTYPAICALAAAAVLDGGCRARGGLFWVGALLWAAPAVALPVAFGAGPALLHEDLSAPGAWAEIAPPMALAALAAVFLFQAWRWLLRGVWVGFVRSALIGAGVLYLTAFQFAFPAIDRIWISERLAEGAAPWRACAAARAEDGARPALAVTNYNEASLPFLAGSDTRQVAPEEAAARLAADPSALVWLADRGAARFEAAAADIGLSAQTLARTSGFNYSNGKSLTFSLLANAEGGPYGACDAGAPTPPEPAQIGAPDAGNPDAGSPETGATETGSPATGSPESRGAETGGAETGGAETGGDESRGAEIPEGEVGRGGAETSPSLGGAPASPVPEAAGAGAGSDAQ